MSMGFGGIAERLSREIGTSRAASYRIAKKLNTLAGKVDWAVPVDGAVPTRKHLKANAERAGVTRVRGTKKRSSKRDRKRS